MKTKVTISELTKEDLVDLFSTALCGSQRFSADYEESIEYDEDACFEDILADILLNGGAIFVTDHYAEGCKHRYWATFDEEENAVYRIYLNDVIVGLERAANGTFFIPDVESCNDDWRDRNISFAKRSFQAMDWNTREWDWLSADCLLQIILFDEIVYG